MVDVNGKTDTANLLAINFQLCWAHWWHFEQLPKTDNLIGLEVAGQQQLQKQQKSTHRHTHTYIYQYTRT